MKHNIISKHALKGKSVVCKYISFEDILPYWNELWPGRVSEIKPLSSIQYCGRTDMSIYDRSTPSFFAIEADDEVVAVGAGFATTDTLYRGRGLWVREDFRGLGYGRRMLALMCRQCRIEGKMKTWGLITTETEGFYSKVKFILTSDEIKNEVDEDGPYYFMIRDSYEPMLYMGDWEGVEDIIEKRPDEFNGAVEYCGTDGKPIEYDDIDPIEFLNGTDI